jgi:hypothetical protein
MPRSKKETNLEQKDLLDVVVQLRTAPCVPALREGRDWTRLRAHVSPDRAECDRLRALENRLRRPTFCRSKPSAAACA